MSDHDHEDCNCAEMEAAVTNLREAIQRYANAQHDHPVMVAEAVVVFETVAFGGEGETSRAISWTIPTEHWSLATAVGLLDVGKGYIHRDLIKQRVLEED